MRSTGKFYNWELDHFCLDPLTVFCGRRQNSHGLNLKLNGQNLGRILRMADLLNLKQYLSSTSQFDDIFFWSFVNSFDLWFSFSNYYYSISRKVQIERDCTRILIINFAVWCKLFVLLTTNALMFCFFQSPLKFRLSAFKCRLSNDVTSRAEILGWLLLFDMMSRDVTT